MREGGRVDGNAGGRLPSLVNPVDDLVFTVALVEADIERQLLRNLSAFCLHVGERLATVDVWLALAEQIEVRPVQHENQTTHIASSEERAWTALPEISTARVLHGRGLL